MKDGFVIRKPVKIHSRARARAAQEAKSKGRHTGYGKLQGALHLRLATAMHLMATLLHYILCRLVLCHAEELPQDRHDHLGRLYLHCIIDESQTCTSCVSSFRACEVGAFDKTLWYLLHSISQDVCV